MSSASLGIVMLQTLLQLTINGLLLGGMYGLVAIGLTMIFGVMNIINFAHGEFLMLAMYSSFWMNIWLGMDPYLTIVVITPLFFLLGLIFQRLMIQPILKAQEVAQIFATVGLSILLQNGALFFWSADYRVVRTSYSSMSFEVMDTYIGLTRLCALLVVFLLAAFLFWLMKKTFLGKAIRATAQDRSAAALMGINIRWIYLMTTGIGIACVGIAGAVLSPVFSIFPTVGIQFVLVAFVVVVLGGMGDLAGAFFGGLIIGLLESYSGFFIAPALKTLVYFVVFVLILLIRPSGIFGTTIREST
jgi:branched-chain amino acid transport system permease protein